MRNRSKPAASFQRTVRARKSVLQSKLKQGGRVLLSGSSREDLRTLGVALASDMDRDLYCVDLSRVVGENVGETEKNLDRVFELAAATEAVLFFDEADVLFGKRAEVKDGHERSANQDLSYFTKRLDAHNGLVILATNGRKNLDEAFLRRMRFTSATRRLVKRNSA